MIPAIQTETDLNFSTEQEEDKSYSLEITAALALISLIGYLWLSLKAKQNEHFYHTRATNFKSEPRKDPVALMLNRRGFFEAESFPGNSRIFLSKEEPFQLIKVTNDPPNRVNEMLAFKKFISKKKWKRLVVPNAVAFERYTKEEKLPLKYTGCWNQMRFYFLHKSRFDSAIGEMSQLLCFSQGRDLLSHRNECRYDNIPLYQNEKKQGCIGLIDLEHFILGKRSLKKANTSAKLMIRFYPFHREIILSKIKAIVPDFIENKQQLDRIQQIALQNFNSIARHYEYIQRHGINRSNSCASINIRQEMLEKIISMISSNMIERFKLKILKPDLEKILQTVFKYHETRLRFVARKTKQPTALIELLDQRSVLASMFQIPLSRSHMYEPGEILPFQIIQDTLKKYTTEPIHVEIVNLIYDVLIEEKVIAGRIARFYGDQDYLML